MYIDSRTLEDPRPFEDVEDERADAQREADSLDATAPPFVPTEDGVDYTTCMPAEYHGPMTVCMCGRAYPVTIGDDGPEPPCCPICQDALDQIPWPECRLCGVPLCDGDIEGICRGCWN